MNFQNPSIEILKDKKLYIFDMDGTIYLGYQVFPFAIRFPAAYCRKQGVKATSPMQAQKATVFSYKNLHTSCIPMIPYFYCVVKK